MPDILRIKVDFTVTDVDGIRFSLSEHRGEIVVINFMAIYVALAKGRWRSLKAYMSVSEVYLS